jgi:hypothetical protein
MKRFLYYGTIKNKAMKKILFLFSFVLIPVFTFSQFEQKIGVDISAGGFKTFGKRFSQTEGALQMPNYKMGLYANGGLQFKLGDHFSLAASFGMMATNGWNYKTSDKKNYLSWSFDDTIHGGTVEGEDYLDLRNFSISIRPKYYLSPEKKWNPYFFAGININWTSAWFENNHWAAEFERGLLLPDDTIPYNDYLEENFGIGFNPGFGVEYCPAAGKFHFYAETGYYFIALDKNNFKNAGRVENLNAVILQIGCRWYFIKSKEL